MNDQESEMNKLLRAQVEEFIRKYDTEPSQNNSDNQVKPLSGCCYLSRGMVRECFNGFTAEQCRQAANGCGCTHQFVPGGTCP